ncbi:MAG TPA: DUF4129 domain-containing protein, partial [Candidatus Nanopelagicales bacterium]|nr:DUF4129 domain-containing protein [Candidatus Nanopelagicales bacterium]
MLPLRIPVELGRDQAAALARDELADPAYHSGQEPLPVRIAGWLIDQLDALLARLSSAAPGGWLGVLGLVVLVVAVLAVLRWRLGPVQRAGRDHEALFDELDAPVSAAEHRRRADSAALAADHAGAVRERLRAIVRSLESRELLDPAPGRTADASAELAGRALPAVAGPLRAGAQLFDEVSYGDRTADRAD